MKHILKLGLVLRAFAIPVWLGARGAHELYDNDQGLAEAVVESLRASPRGWLKYCDAQVEFVGMHVDIATAPARIAGLATCWAELIGQRIKDFASVPNPF